MQCWIFELLLNFHARYVKNIAFERFELHPSMRSDTILICHSNLGTEHKSHQRLISIRHENGVIMLQNEYPLYIFTQRKSNTIQYHAASMNDKAIQIPKEVIRIE